MKRRHFLALSALATPVAARAGEAEEKWWEQVQNVLSFTAKSEEGNIILEVDLEIPKEDELRRLPEVDGEYAGYMYRGEKLPRRFWPNCSLITKFDFKWDGKSIEIPRRFWRDLAGFDIQTIPNKPALKGDEDGRYNEFLETLRHPRVLISADGGTALIEWVRPEECDGRSTTRWIISRSGNVLRHRHEPHHEC